MTVINLDDTTIDTSERDAGRHGRSILNARRVAIADRLED